MEGQRKVKILNTTLSFSYIILPSGITGKFGGGGVGAKSRFLILAFPGRNFHFGRPWRSFRFQWFPKSKKQKQNQLWWVLFPLIFLIHFPPLIIFFKFSSFSSFFLPFCPIFFYDFPFFSLPHFSRLVAKNVQVEMAQGVFTRLPNKSF